MAKPRITIAVIGEGITEKYYFQSLRDILRIRPTAIKPKKSNLAEFEISIKDCIKKGYNEIYCLIDMDNKVMDGNHDHIQGAKDYNRLRSQYHNKTFVNGSKEKTKVVMVESFPSTEMFFRYYFGYTSASYGNKQLKEELARRFGYSTQEIYFIRHSLHNTMEETGGSLKIAISASQQSIACRDFGNVHCTYSEIGTLIKFLL